MAKKENITIVKKWEDKSMYCRTIDPTDGFFLSGGVLTLYNFKPYKSSSHNTSADVTILEDQGDKILLRVDSIDWHRKYQHPFKTQGCFLFQAHAEKYGRVQTYVDRVPCSKETIAEAEDYLTPAEVKKARDAGRIVKRQGDIFFIEMKNKSNFSVIAGTDHKAVETKKGLSIQHPQHKSLPLPSGAWKAVQRKTMNHIKAD